MKIFKTAYGRSFQIVIANIEEHMLTLSFMTVLTVPCSKLRHFWVEAMNF